MKALIIIITLDNMVNRTKPQEIIEDIIRETKTTYVTSSWLVFRKNDLWQQKSKKQRSILFAKIWLNSPVNWWRAVIEEFID